MSSYPGSSGLEIQWQDGNPSSWVEVTGEWTVGPMLLAPSPPTPSPRRRPMFCQRAPVLDWQAMNKTLLAALLFNLTLYLYMYIVDMEEME